MEFFRIVAALGTVFALLGIVYFVSNRARSAFAVTALRAPLIWSHQHRKTKPIDSDSVRVLKRVSLTATHQLHLIGTAQGTFLLCTHPQGCALLTPCDSRPQSDRDHLDSQDLRRYAS
jgi:hypothetical protein